MGSLQQDLWFRSARKSDTVHRWIFSYQVNYNLLDLKSIMFLSDLMSPNMTVVGDSLCQGKKRPPPVKK